MVIGQGDVCWANLSDPSGSAAGYRRPVVVLQSNSLNRSRLATVVCVPLTSNVGWASAPGNVLLEAAATGLPKDSVANTTLVLAIDRSILEPAVGRIASKHLRLLFGALDVVLGR